MSKIIRKASRERIQEYLFFYDYPGTGSGFCFPCSATHIIDESKLSAAALENLRQCRSGENGTVAGGCVDVSHTIFIPAVLRCDCLREVELIDSFLNPCSCGRDYDGAGNLLAPRSQWGEETGETISDILGPGDEL